MPRRDWGREARDYVEACGNGCRQPQPDDYVLCTGASLTVLASLSNAAFA
jgi:GDP-D-mannose dehydratase